MNCAEVFDTLNLGIVIVDAEYRIAYWNQWMAICSDVSSEEVVGKNIFGMFPNLDQPVYHRSFRSVFNFGNNYFFSQKLHRYLFPIRNLGTFDCAEGYMQQSCSLSPIREGGGSTVTHICITVQDVTDIAMYESLLVEMNFRDALTGVYNRRFFDQRLAEEFEKHRRHKRSIGLLMIDLDYFKEVNDTYGHRCGDFILRSVCETIRSEMRRTDVLARYGGEEFVCLLAETNVHAAERLAERIKDKIAGTAYMFNEVSVKVTVSVGVSAVDGEDVTSERLVENADSGLYKAKKAGRNRVVLFR